MWVQYLEHDIDLFSQWVGIDQGQLEGNCVGVEEGAGLHTHKHIVSMRLYSALHYSVFNILLYSLLLI